VSFDDPGGLLDGLCAVHDDHSPAHRLGQLPDVLGEEDISLHPVPESLLRVSAPL
jgi:hypothetical protein